MATDAVTDVPKNSRDERDNLEIWKHFSSSGSTDKHTMLTTVTWLLGFGAAAITYIVTTLIESQRPPVLKYPWQIAVVSIVGAAIAALAAYIALLYAGYASRNWAKADTIAVANGWLDLLPDSKEPPAGDATRLTRRAWRYGRGVDHARTIPPVFLVFFFTRQSWFSWRTSRCCCGRSSSSCVDVGCREQLGRREFLLPRSRVTQGASFGGRRPHLKPSHHRCDGNTLCSQSPALSSLSLTSAC
jgi:hypothetical protein